MDNIIEKLESANWENIKGMMDQNGYTLIPKLLTNEQCEELKANYYNDKLYRKTVVMERYRFGLGEYKYFNYPLPAIIETIRTNIYPHLAPIANGWFNALNIERCFPLVHKDLLRQCHENNQNKATVLILKYGKDGHNTLHQDLYGDVYFPIQIVLFLNEVDKDFTGGEFVLTEQTPRSQSKAIVLTPGKGDALIFTTNFRPVKGKKGYYKVNMKHGVSAVLGGERNTLGIIFHDAVS